MEPWTTRRPITFANLPVLRAADARAMLWATPVVVASFFVLSRILPVNPEHPAFATPEGAGNVALAIAVFPVVCWVYFLAWYFSVLGFEADLRRIERTFADEVAPLYEPLRISPHTAGVLWLANWGLVAALGHITDAQTFGVEPGFRYLQVFSEGPAMVFHWWFVVPWCALMIGLGSACLLRQTAVLGRLVRTLPIQLEATAVYEPLSNTLLRVFVVFSMLAALLPGVALAGDQARAAAGVFLAVVVVVGLPLCAFVARPVFVLRGRVAAEKQARLAALRAALESSADADAPEPAARAGLLTEYMFVESRREWPVAPQVQWVFLFGLLPPTTWVMAAALENLLFG